MHPERVAPYLDIDQLPLERQASRVKGISQAVGCGSHGTGQVARNQPQLQRRRLGGRQTLQVVDHPGQSQHLIAQRRQIR